MGKEKVKAIKLFLKNIQKKFKPEKIILFGSRARDDALEDSDFDLLIISKKFKGMNQYKRIISIYSLERESVSVDVICLTPEEYSQRSEELSIIGEAAKEGVEITA